MEEAAERPPRSSEQLRARTHACSQASSANVKSYNYAVRYDAEDVQRHWLTEARYVGSDATSAANGWEGMDAHPPGSWAAFTTGVLPRAPLAGRTAGLRAPPSEPMALGPTQRGRV